MVLIPDLLVLLLLIHFLYQPCDCNTLTQEAAEDIQLLS